MMGKSLLVIASGVNVKTSDATMQATLDTHGIDRLLGGYGIELRKDAIADFASPLRLEINTASGPVKAPLPAFLMVTGDRVDASFPPLFRLESVVVPFASS